MKIGLGKSCKTKLNKGNLKGVMEIRTRVKIYGVPGSSGSDVDFRLLEDGFIRLLEDGSFRILE